MFPELRTPNLLLREIRKDDQSKIYEGLSHPDVIAYYGVNYTSFEATKEQMNWYENLVKSGSGIWWAICNVEKQDFYGACGFNNLTTVHKKAELGFWLLPEFWGQGIVAEAVEEITRYAFERLELHRIEAYVETENKNSKRVLEKLGFRKEGVMRDVEIKNGRFISLAVYGRLRNDKTKR